MTVQRGRPRDPERDARILDAARTVISRRGYTGATIDEISKVAGVGKDTIYRRWKGKDALAVDLVDRLARHAVRPAQLELDPYFNLFVYLKDIVRLCTTTDFGGLVAGVVGAAARDAELAAAFQGFWLRRRDLAVDLVRDITGSHTNDSHTNDSHTNESDPNDLDTVLDRLFGPIYYRLLLTGMPITDEYLWDLVLQVPAPTPSPTPEVSR
ncbi:MAG: TetR/AcrR family transcriptional regulator [Acidimicrobiales bacterium]